MITLNQIWLKSPLYASEGRTIKVFPGLLVRVNRRNVLVDIEPDLPATHLIKQCFASGSDLYIQVKSIETKEVDLIKYKQL